MSYGTQPILVLLRLFLDFFECHGQRHAQCVSHILLRQCQYERRLIIVSRAVPEPAGISLNGCDMAWYPAPSAALVHAAGNLQREMRFSRGDIDEAWSQCPHIVEDTYVTPRKMHAFMETEGGYMVPEADGTLSVCVGGHHGPRDRMQLARILGIPEDRIRVVTSPTGGAFGGKDELTVQPAGALLALKSGRPVRLHLDRAESSLGGRMRNPMRIQMRTGCDASGRLIAQEMDLLMDTGAYASLSPSVLETCLEHACGRQCPQPRVARLHQQRHLRRLSRLWRQPDDLRG